MTSIAASRVHRVLRALIAQPRGSGSDSTAAMRRCSASSDILAARSRRPGATLEPVEPIGEAFAGSSGNQDHLDSGPNAARVADCRLDVEVHVRQQVDLVQDEEVRRVKHVRILERLVVAFRHRQNHDLVRLAQIERRRAHEVAHVLDQQQAVVGELELRKRVRDHLRVQVAPLSGVDLHCSRARLAHAIGVARCLLVALDDGDGRSSLPRADGLYQQRRLPRSGARHQVQRKHAAIVEDVSVRCRDRIVLCKQVTLDLEHARGRRRNASAAGAMRAPENARCVGYLVHIGMSGR